MNLDGRSRLRLEAATDWLPRWLAVWFPVSIAGTVLGQSVLPPPPGYQGAPATPQMGIPSWNVGQPTGQVNGQMNAEPNNGQVLTPPNAPEGQPGQTTTPATSTAPLESLMQWGALHLRARATYQFLYSTDVHTAPGKTTDTFTHTFSPGVTATLGPHVSLDYTPSFRFFSERNFRNTIDQFVNLNTGLGYGDWMFSLSQSFSRSDEPLVETGSQTDQENFQTGLSASYQVNDKISLQTSGSMGFLVVGHSGTNTFGGATNALPAELSDSQNYSGSEWLNYQFNEKLDGGLGVTVGYSAQDHGFNSLNEQYTGRFTWHPGAKLTIYLNGGIEDEQFLNINAPAIVTPIFSAAATYNLFEQTTFSLAANRAVNASLFRSEVTETSAVSIGVQQRLLGELEFSLGFSYSTSDFKTTTFNLATSRSDDTEVFNVGLNVPFLKHGSIGAFYDYSQNSSSEPGFGFSSSQVGATLSWAY